MQLIIGFCLGALLFFLYAMSADNTACLGKERFVRGDLACKDHGGLKAWDYWENFKCKDGVVISNFKEGVNNEQHN